MFAQRIHAGNNNNRCAENTHDPVEDLEDWEEGVGGGEGGEG